MLLFPSQTISMQSDGKLIEKAVAGVVDVGALGLMARQTERLGWSGWTVRRTYMALQRLTQAVKEDHGDDPAAAWSLAHVMVIPEAASKDRLKPAWGRALRLLAGCPQYWRQYLFVLVQALTRGSPEFVFGPDVLPTALYVAAQHWKDGEDAWQFAAALAAAYCEAFACQDWVQRMLAQFACALALTACTQAVCHLRPCCVLVVAMCVQGTEAALPHLVNALTGLVACDGCRVQAAQAMGALLARENCAREREAVAHILPMAVALEQARLNRPEVLAQLAVAAADASS